MSLNHPSRPRAFLAAPFAAALDTRTRTLAPSARSLIEGLIHVLDERGWAVDNAHEREGWGLDWMSPDACTPLDFRGVTSADLLVALPGNPSSGGVHIEIGWASASGVPIVLLLEEGVDYSHLVVGLHTVANATEIRYRSPNDGCAALDAWLAQRAGTRPDAAHRRGPALPTT